MNVRLDGQPVFCTLPSRIPPKACGLLLRRALAYVAIVVAGLPQPP